jgi:hypothetical protein
MVETVVWMALPVTVFGLMAAAVPSPDDAAPRWRARFARLARLLRGRPPVAAADAPDDDVDRPHRRDPGHGRHRGNPDPDALHVLALQVRLGVLADHIRALECDEHAWARARKLQAAQAAYDELLDEACRLAGVPSHLPPADGPGLRLRSEPGRFEDELALAQRGWSW